MLFTRIRCIIILKFVFLSKCIRVSQFKKNNNSKCASLFDKLRTKLNENAYKRRFTLNRWQSLINVVLLFLFSSSSSLICIYIHTKLITNDILYCMYRIFKMPTKNDFALDCRWFCFQVQWNHSTHKCNFFLKRQLQTIVLELQHWDGMSVFFLCCLWAASFIC